MPGWAVRRVAVPPARGGCPEIAGVGERDAVAVDVQGNRQARCCASAIDGRVPPIARQPADEGSAETIEYTRDGADSQRNNAGRPRARDGNPAALNRRSTRRALGGDEGPPRFPRRSGRQPIPRVRRPCLLRTSVVDDNRPSATRRRSGPRRTRPAPLAHSHRADDHITTSGRAATSMRRGMGCASPSWRRRA